jgi:hypothetical protein
VFSLIARRIARSAHKTVAANFGPGGVFSPYVKEQLMRSNKSFHCNCWLLSVFLMFAASAHAERMPVTLSMTARSDLRPGTNLHFLAVAPNTLTLSTTKDAFQNSSVTELTLTNLNPDTSDRMLHYKHGDPVSYEWTITAANAADFGVNWLEFQNRLNETKPNDVYTFVRFFHPSPLNGSNPQTTNTIRIATALEEAGAPRGSWATEFQLQEVKIAVDYYFWHDILEDLRGVQIQADIHGEANVRVIPEPEAWAMLSLGLLFVGVVATKRNRISAAV